MKMEFLWLMFVSFAVASPLAFWFWYNTGRKLRLDVDNAINEATREFMIDKFADMYTKLNALEEKQTVFEEEMEIKHTDFCSGRITRDNEIIRITNGHTKTLNRHDDLIRDLEKEIKDDVD